IVVAQVNKNMPRTHGESFVHVSDLDYIVEHDEPLIELLRGELTEEDKKIGQYCADLVNDGDTLQLGIGSLPDAVLLSLYGKKDLGIHTEMFSESVMDLVNAGVINNSKKTLHKGKMVATFIMGSRALYDFIDDNPMVYMAPVDYVNDPYVIAKNDNMVSINSCIEIDLSGQICSESVGLRQISASGGQVDYVRGTNMSKGGRAIIAVASATKDGKTSKIVPFLNEGATVTTLRNDVTYVITENGVAYLKGKTLQDRGRELIKIAHPNFRDSLIEEWERRYKAKF
ncbi:MAG: acetyl-CoA hydrolase/transferase family protein, partial [Christensenellaceae bacterium]